MAPPVFKTGLAANIVAGGFDSLPPPPFHFLSFSPTRRAQSQSFREGSPFVSPHNLLAGFWGIRRGANEIVLDRGDSSMPPSMRRMQLARRV